jgi:hypothetical protein
MYNLCTSQGKSEYYGPAFLVLTFYNIATPVEYAELLLSTGCWDAGKRFNDEQDIFCHRHTRTDTDRDKNRKGETPVEYASLSLCEFHPDGIVKTKAFHWTSGAGGDGIYAMLRLADTHGLTGTGNEKRRR